MKKALLVAALAMATFISSTAAFAQDDTGTDAGKMKSHRKHVKKHHHRHHRHHHVAKTPAAK